MNTSKVSALVLGLSCVIALAACGSSKDGQSTNNTGSVGGKAFTPASSLFTVFTSADLAMSAQSKVGDANATAAGMNPGAPATLDPNALTDPNALVDPNAALNPNLGNPNVADPNFLSGQTIAIVLTTAPQACTAAQANETPANASFLYLVLLNITKPGTYQVGDTRTSSALVKLPAASMRPVAGPMARVTSTAPNAGGTALAGGGFQTTDASCNGDTNPITSGTITITSLDTQHTIAGSYDVTLRSNDKLSGSFSADNCAVPQTNQDPNSVCK